MCANGTKNLIRKSRKHGHSCQLSGTGGFSGGPSLRDATDFSHQHQAQRTVVMGESVKVPLLEMVKKRLK